MAGLVVSFTIGVVVESVLSVKAVSGNISFSRAEILPVSPIKVPVTIAKGKRILYFLSIIEVD